MNKFLMVGEDSRALARDSVIEGLFTTITFTLEQGVRGSRFPKVIEHLYGGHLNPSDGALALRELHEIEVAMRKTPVSAVVWTPADARRGDDHSQPVNHQASNVFEYFVDIEGRPLISRLQEGVQQSIDSGQALLLDAPTAASALILIGLVLAGLGAGWMWLGRALIPNATVSKFATDRSGIPLWTFGMYLVMMGVPLVITAPFPSVRDWFFRRQGVVIGIAIAAVIGWLVICARAGFIK